MPWSIALAVFTSGFMGRKQPENWLFASPAYGSLLTS